MRLKKINKDIIFKCRFFQAEFIHNVKRENPNYGLFSTRHHKYVSIGKHLLAIHFRKRQQRKTTKK